jgi:hypothetical protein
MTTAFSCENEQSVIRQIFSPFRVSGSALSEWRMTVGRAIAGSVSGTCTATVLPTRAEGRVQWKTCGDDSDFTQPGRHPPWG